MMEPVYCEVCTGQAAYEVWVPDRCVKYCCGRDLPGAITDTLDAGVPLVEPL